MKRTGGIEEFEFLGLADALALITQNKEKRQLERQKKGKSDTKQEEIEIQKEINENIESDAINVTSSKVPINDETGDILWEISADIDEKFNSPDKKTDVLGSWADMGSKEELGDQSETVPKLESTIKDPIPLKSRQTNVLITVAGWVSYDKVDSFSYDRMITLILILH